VNCDKRGGGGVSGGGVVWTGRIVAAARRLCMSPNPPTWVPAGGKPLVESDRFFHYCSCPRRIASLAYVPR
jgi:hypothetical protein